MLNKSNIFGIKKLFDKTNTNMILLKNQIIKINNQMKRNIYLIKNYYPDILLIKQ